MPTQPHHPLPQLLQNVDAESGAVALGIVLAIYGHSRELRELNHSCGVTRDGTTPTKLLMAAKAFGLNGNWKTLDDQSAGVHYISQLKGPAISVDQGNHYAVILSSSDQQVQIYDTGKGRKSVPIQELKNNQLLLLEPTAEFRPRQQPTYWANALKLALPLRRELLAVMLLTSGSVVPTLMIAACSSQFIDQFLEQHRLSFGVPIVWLALIAICLSICMSLLSNLLLRRMSYVLERRMADDVLETLFSRSVQFLNLRSRGDLASRLMYPYYLPGTAIFSFLAPALGLWSSCLIVGFSAFISFPLFLLVLSGFLIILRASYQLTLKTADNLTVRQKANNSRYAAAYQIISNLESFKGIGTEFTMLQYWQSFFAEGIKQNQLIGRQKIIRNVSISGSIFITQAMLLGVGGLLIIKGNVSLGSLLAFLFIQGQIADSLYAIPAISNGWQSLQGMLLLYNDLQQGEASTWLRCFEREETSALQNTTSALEIELKQASFRFSQHDEPVLADLNYRFGAGEQVLVRGDGGSGKTVLMQMVAGLLHPSDGELLANGTPIQAIDSRHWHRHVSYVDSEPTFFTGSLMDNITAWRSGCSRRDAALAAEVVGLSTWIQRFEAGFEHHLDNAEQILCNSQKLQFSIARALCIKPKVLLLDVNTSELRREDEQRLHAYCRTEGITLLTLSERGASDHGCDQVIQLKPGRQR